MLTADLVRIRRTRDGELFLREVHPKSRDRLVTVARGYIEAAKASVGQPREAFLAACADVEVANPDRKVAEGLRKLVVDRCDFSADDRVDPLAIRREVFTRAAVARREHDFAREEVVAAAAEALGLDVAAVEASMFADLKQAHLCRSFDAPNAEVLVDTYDLAQAQAVLLKAVRVTARVKCADGGAYRALFRKLKFRRLLHTIHPDDDGGYRLVLDGPFSLFRQSTKYGLQLALMLPAIAACDTWSVDADVRWGKDKAKLRFHYAGAQAADASPARLPDDVQTLVDRFKALDTGWKVRASTKILELPGVGLCVPDLVFTREGAKVYLEVMGYWSREAVWRRVDLVEAGLRENVLFAVSERLRVSEAVLDGELPGGLYVYKGVMSARTVAKRLEQYGQGA